MKKNFYLLLVALFMYGGPLSISAFNGVPTVNFSTEKPLITGCEGVSVVAGSGNVVIAGLGAYSDIQIFTAGFAARVFQQTVNTATITVPIATAGDYIVKIWSNPNPAAFCENNFPITVGGGGGGSSTLTLNGCNNASAIAAAGDRSAIVNYATPTATTTCATDGATVTRTSGGASGTAFPIGASQVCFSATDNCGNTKTCCITITVTATTGGGGTCTEYTVGDANDCAGGSWQPYGLYVGTTLYRVKDGKFRKNSDGTATLTATYTTDGWSIAGSANVTFTGMTMTAPAGSPKYSTCTQGAATTDWMYYTAFSGTLTLNGVATSITRRGEAFQVGTGANWQNAGDLGGSGWFTLGTGVLGDFNFRLSSPTNCGGGDPCLTDAIPPTFNGCPTTINLTTNGTCANASWTTPTATDNCGTPSVVQLLGGANGSCFAVGTTLVKYMATDTKGNTAICAFNVVVTKIVVDPCATDVTAPVFTNCPANIVKTPTAAGSCWTINWTPPSATDNCGTPIITQTAGPTNGSCLAPGSYGVTYKATDAKGNSATCSFTITVNSYLNCGVVTGNSISKSCVNNIPSLNGSALTGYEYVWLSSTTSCPSQTSQAIAGATGQHYTLPSRPYVTTYFVRCARPIGCTTWGPINESNCVTVYPSDCAPTVCNAPYTPNGWMYLGVYGTSHYYKWTGSGDITCTDARTKCQNIGGRLPVIKTAAQNAFLQSKLGQGSAWIGIRRSGNSWLWDNGAVATYYNWSPGEPNNYQNSENCAQIYQDGKWNDCSTWAYNWCIAEIPCGGVGAYLATNDRISMDASAELSRSRISWISNTGYKNDFFTVEKVNQASGNFERLEIVNNKYSSDANEYYTVYDNTPTEGDNTYRVTVNYVDGTNKISDLKTINYKGLADIRLFPNPANDLVGVDLSRYKGQAVTISVYNQFGQQVLTRQIDKVDGETVNLDISQQQTGNYLLRVVAKGRKDAAQQLHITK